VSVEPASEDAIGEYSIEKDAISIDITYSTAPSTGTDNLSWEWGAAVANLSTAVGLSAGGTIDKNGDATTTVFNIPHGLSSTPTIFFAHHMSSAARGDYLVNVDATNITLTYASPPPTGTANLSFVWGAGFVNEASVGFTPSSTHTITNKVVGDMLTFDKVGVPANQSDAEHIIQYNKEIDANNNTLAVKQQIGGSIVEVSYF
jgi:hypothetical protein